MKDNKNNNIKKLFKLVNCNNRCIKNLLKMLENIDKRSNQNSKYILKLGENTKVVSKILQAITLDMCKTKEIEKLVNKYEKKVK